MAAHAHLKNEFTEDEKCHNLMSWLSCLSSFPGLVSRARWGIRLYHFLIIAFSSTFQLMFFFFSRIPMFTCLSSHHLWTVLNLALLVLRDVSVMKSESLIAERTINKLIEPPHDKSNKMTCASSEDSDQLGHPAILIRVFAMRSIGS